MQRSRRLTLYLLQYSIRSRIWDEKAIITVEETKGRGRGCEPAPGLRHIRARAETVAKPTKRPALRHTPTSTTLHQTHQGRRG
jgi:hypothetical protein